MRMPARLHLSTNFYLFGQSNLDSAIFNLYSFCVFIRSAHEYVHFDV